MIDFLFGTVKAIGIGLVLYVVVGWLAKLMDKK